MVRNPQALRPALILFRIQGGTMQYSPKELAYLSTIIKRTAAIRDWDTDLDSSGTKKISEVQCMQIVGDDKIFIATNPGEQDAVRYYLSGFGVNNALDFERCLFMSHELLSMRHQLFSDAVTVRLKPDTKRKYSGQEKLVVDSFRKPSFLAGNYLKLYQDMFNAINDGGTDPAGKKLSWFLRKLIACPITTNAVKSTGAPLAVLNEYSKAVAVNVLDSIENVHAEIVLLTFLAEEVTTNPHMFENKVIHLGGAKKACAHCAAWIALYKRWMLNTYKVKVRTTENDGGDTRGEANAAETSKRPSRPTLATLRGAPKLLFTPAGATELHHLNTMADDENLWLLKKHA
ncbi:MAG: hypothetical protein LBJ37_18410 [Paucimonas sp.]|jgi:hypothetical protein|nr:hypothetical protein [Paucimonas sp.]